VIDSSERLVREALALGWKTGRTQSGKTLLYQPGTPAEDLQPIKRSILVMAPEDVDIVVRAEAAKGGNTT
jgi:hypothetical protein